MATPPDPNVIHAELSAPEFILRRLCEEFPSGDPRITRDGAIVYLSATELAPFFPQGALLDHAEDVLQVLLGYLRLESPSFLGAELTGNFQRGDGLGPGDRVNIVQLGTAIEYNYALPVSAVVGGVVVSPPPPPGPSYVALAVANPDVREVLTILGRTDQSIGWVDLYKIYEIVRDALGGSQPALIATGWTNEHNLKAFTGSANRPDVSGNGARHARQPGGPPKRTMDLATAQGYIREMARSWMDSLR